MGRGSLTGMSGHTHTPPSSATTREGHEVPSIHLGGYVAWHIDPWRLKTHMYISLMSLAYLDL
jgi:hypothetical protein